MKVATNEEHKIKEILVRAWVKQALTLKKDSGQLSYGNFVLETILLHSLQTKSVLDPGSGVFLSHIAHWVNEF